MEPLEIGRENEALIMYEETRRMKQDHSYRLLVESWHLKSRIKQNVLHHVSEVKEKYHHPENGKESF